MNDTQALVLIHVVAWPILIWLLSKTVQTSAVKKVKAK